MTGAQTEKRKLEDEADTKESEPSANVTKRSRVIGPTLPPGFGKTEEEDSDTKDQSDKSESSDDDDDGYGPMLPPTGANTQLKENASVTITESYETEQSKPLQRDDWMLKPPDSSDWSSRVDPTKIRNRKFNMGRASSSSTGPADTWTETAEEKKQRLTMELMGVRAPANQKDTSAGASEISDLDLQKKKQVEEYNAKNRKATLYTKHQDIKKKSQSKEEDDDPSARPFDKEKDVRGPTKVSNAKRREFLNRASDFGSRFSGGKFL